MWNQICNSVSRAANYTRDVKKKKLGEIIYHDMFRPFSLHSDVRRKSINYRYAK